MLGLNNPFSSEPANPPPAPSASASGRSFNRTTSGARSFHRTTSGRQFNRTLSSNRQFTRTPSTVMDPLSLAFETQSDDELTREDHDQQVISKANVKLVNAYLNQTDWKSQENSNKTYSLQGLMHYISSEIVSNYWLNHIYKGEVSDYVEENRFHIHDLGILSAYCAGWSVEDLLLQGFGGVPDKVQCRPPKHFNTALNQAVNFLFTVQGELAGAQALSNVDTFFAPFIRYDNLSEKDVFKYLQSFVYALNVPNRCGAQAPFTNVSMDMTCPDNMRGNPVIIGGELHPEWTYDMFQEEMDMFNRAFCAIMQAGDSHGNVFTFPIPTYNLPKNMDFEDPRFEPIWDMTAKYGIPYFSNFINSDLNPDDFRSMCCRLRLDVSQLHSRSGSLFGSSPLTGSLGVVTLNLPNLALQSDGTKESFFELIADAARVAKDSLLIKRKMVDANPQLYPYAAHYLEAIKQRTGSYWTNHFSTIGVNGMNEALVQLTGEGVATQQALVVETLEMIKSKLQEFQLETGHLFNLEATPAESTAFKLAQKDRQLFPKAELPTFYTNSTALPVDSTVDLYEALKHQEPIQTSYTGGTVFHAFLGEQLPTGKHARDVVRAITTQFKLPYVTLTPTFSICKSHGYISGEKQWCPKCKEECLIYSRIVGYFRPVRDWNKGKKGEFRTRVTYEVNDKLFKGPQAAQDDPDSMVDVPEMGELPVAGFIKQTFTDFPGRTFASVMFTSRCNLACGWCHNGEVVCGERSGTNARNVLRSILATEHKNLVVSGGEPTIHRGLIPFLRILKRHGVHVKLDTNGTNPQILRTVFEEDLAEFIAMDIKADPKRYEEVAGRKVDPRKLEESISMIRGSGVEHEFRTTVVPGIVDMEDLMVAKDLAGGKLKLQRFRAGENNLKKRFRKYKEHNDQEWSALTKEVETA